MENRKRMNVAIGALFYNDVMVIDRESAPARPGEPGRHARSAIAAWLLLVGLWLCVAWPVLAGDAVAEPAPLRDYALDVWTSREGLPHNSIRSIAQTPEGHLWFATWEGLVRYNGLDFTVFDRSTRPALLDNGVGTLFVDEDGALWISDSRGNVGRRSDSGELRFWPRQPPEPQVIIQSMRKDSRGRLWLLFEGNGLGYLDPGAGRVHYEAPPPGTPLSTSYMHMAIDAQDRIWVGTFDGLMYREPDGRYRRALEGFALPRGLAWPYRAPDGSMWIAAGDSLYRLEDGRPVLKHRLPGQGRLTAMLQDRHGDLWVGTENNGVLRVGHHGIERLPASMQVPGGRISCLFEDAEGSIWVGANGGLFRLRETLFSNYTRRDGLSGDYTRAVLEDRDGRLWIGGSVGLDVMHADHRIVPQRLPTAGGQPPSVLSLALGHDGDIWAGTYGDGVFRIDAAGHVRRYGFDEGLPRGNVRAIDIDDDGTVWLGTQRGVVRVDDAGLHAVTVPGMPTGLITALGHADGALWIGTIEGIWVLRGDRVQRIELEAMGGARTVFGFLQVGHDVWITTDRGLYRDCNGQLARVGLEQGMPVDAVFQMVLDRLGNAWITSNRGVLRTDLAALDAVADGRRPRIEVELYNEADGMANAQANGSSMPSAQLRRDGTLWIATAGGLTMADPKRLQWLQQRLPPPAVIENAQLDGEPVSWQRGHVALPGGHRLSVSYVGLSYLLSDRIVYRTRLQGLDDGWVERGRQRSVEFIGLPPGDYTLHVAAAHPGGAWSQREAVWSFTIEPLFWQRRSVQAAAGLLLALSLLALYRYRIHRYRRSNLRLARQVDERTHDLQLQTERLLAADQEKSALLDRLRQQAEAFERQALEDVLTRLPNRRAFDEALVREMARSRRDGRPLCLVSLDVDHFKQVNDLHSHGTGDAVLREVAQLLREGCRAGDLPARMGGEEFALLLGDTGIGEAEALCQRLRAQFHERRQWAGIEGLGVTFSAGVVAMGPGDATPAALYQRADRALYRAKNGGRDRICLG